MCFDCWRVVDIGRADSVEMMEADLIPFFNEEGSKMNHNGKYLTGNSFDDSKNMLGNSYSIYETRGGSKLLFLGFLYDFENYAENSEVIGISSSTQEVIYHELCKISDLI